MSKTIQINATYINGQKFATPKTLYIPSANAIIRPYLYKARSGIREDNTMNAIVTVDNGTPQRLVYYTAQTVASLVSAANT